MKSDFAAARVHLDRAYHYLQGGDRASQEARVALVELLEAIVAAECREVGAGSEVLTFPMSKRTRPAR
jgi:hypothetical protein